MNQMDGAIMTMNITLSTSVLSIENRECICQQDDAEEGCCAPQNQRREVGQDNHFETPFARKRRNRMKIYSCKWNKRGVTSIKTIGEDTHSQVRWFKRQY
jgi:hypothetical protein